ncbi:hypothetical protein IQ249_14840 [Lusitaniella coriacea LEGE 07157]|uniref:Uncharacterized protein n=1 Tax=Lusitaniella coriacea LEGE 07157 TaxID=945747 RepID=A0A8J7JBU1_9CYAN|nr:hypothetical protein [Lusitaniella coriacea]MBE9117175.1 hypothetical protein [Lusitaniella coriacea LEGE 07157]
MLATIICCCCAWLLPIAGVIALFRTLQNGLGYVKQLHQIPCHECEFFTNDHRLKCTVCPIKAGTEDAIGCLDFQPQTAACNACQIKLHKHDFGGTRVATSSYN